MSERQQVDLTRNFQFHNGRTANSTHMVVDVTNQPIVHNSDTFHTASKSWKKQTLRGMAEDVLARAGIDNHLPAEPN